ncbi:hypothetical protein LXL04_027843 [Taraxacum kok-saghyz]
MRVLSPASQNSDGCAPLANAQKLEWRMENERNNWRWRLKSNGNEDDGRSSELNLAGKLQTRLPTDGHCISRRQVVMVGPHAYTHSTHTSMSSSFSSVRLSLSLSLDSGSRYDGGGCWCGNGGQKLGVLPKYP